MAKRRRLTPAQAGYLAGAPASPLPRPASVPIAHVAGEASAASALAEVSEALTSARAEGRLVVRLPLDRVEIGYLVRDRLETDEEELSHLVESLRAHGQRSPIEVAEIASAPASVLGGAETRYGLISGWRRLTALRRLYDETGDARFATVLALPRRPDTAEDAYIAMVEENEVRLGLSYYERARIAAKAVEQGVFATEKLALQRLFAAASRARRSKIGSFLTIYHALDGALRFPAALPERLGLMLARHLEDDPGAAAALGAGLAAHPAAAAAEEQAWLSEQIAAVTETMPAGKETEPAADVLSSVVGEPVIAAQPPAPTPRAERPVPSIDPAAQDTKPATADSEEIRPGVFLTVIGGWTKPVLTVSGPAVDPVFRERLEHWLRNG